MVSKGPRKQLATVIYAGLGGAVLGLSTLSFHGRPQDHLESIFGGFAIGIIVGAIYSSYGVAKDPNKLYGSAIDLKPSKIGPKSHVAIDVAPNWLKYQWTF